MHIALLSYKIGACQIFVNNFSAKNKKILEFGLVQPGPYAKKQFFNNIHLNAIYHIFSLFSHT